MRLGPETFIKCDAAFNHWSPVIWEGFPTLNRESKVRGHLKQNPKGPRPSSTRIGEKYYDSLFIFVHFTRFLKWCRSNYHLRTKLRKNNVFSHVCLFTGRGSTWPLPMNLIIQGLALAPACLPYRDQFAQPCPPASDIWWSSLETCSNVFKWGSPGADICWLATEAWTVDQQVTRVLLECFPVQVLFLHLSWAEVTHKFFFFVIYLVIFHGSLHRKYSFRSS